MQHGLAARIAWVVALSGLASFAALADDRDSSDKPKPSSEKSQPADSPAKPPAKPQAKPAYNVDDDDVITNEDLERMMQGLSPLEAQAGVYQTPPGAQPEKPAGPPDATGAPSPVKAGGTPETAPVPKGPTVEESEQKVVDLQSRVAELEKAVLAVRNPLLPRTWATPESTKEDDEKSGYAKLDNASRLGQREAELAKAREELAKAREELTGGGGGDDDSNSDADSDSPSDSDPSHRRPD